MMNDFTQRIFGGKLFVLALVVEIFQFGNVSVFQKLMNIFLPMMMYFIF